MKMNGLSTAALLLPLSICGCFSSWHASPFNGGEGLEGQTVLIVPFRESLAGADLWYGESRRGQTITKGIRMWAAGQDIDARFVTGERVEEAQKTIRNWAKPRLSDAEWARIGRNVGARFLVEGSIEKLQLKDPRSIGFFSARAVISYRVLETEKGRVVHQRKGWRVGSERGNEDQFKVDLEFDNPQEIELRLLALTARRLAEELYGYYD